MASFLQIDDGAPDLACNCAFELLHKTMAENPSGTGKGLDAPHPNRFLQALVEDTTQRLAARLGGVYQQFGDVLAGAPVLNALKAFSWNEDEMAVFRARLEGREPATYRLDDWLLLVDLLMRDSLSPELVDDEAAAMAIRADLLGRIQATLPAHQPLAFSRIQHVTRLLPTTFPKVPLRALSPVELAILEVGQARAAIAVTNIVEDARTAMKRTVLEHTQAMVLGQQGGTPRELQTKLFDRFAEQNRDMRRVAVTEIGEIAGQAYVSTLIPGTRVRRVEDYEDACDFCASVNGKEFSVVDPHKPEKDWDKEVWLGKTNVGRSASPAKRVGGRLVAREPDELWSVPAGTVHPNCRGRWIALPGQHKPAEVSQEFADWLTDLLAPTPPATVA